jgi:hypothetical protein
VPTIGDEARASTGHTITITDNATCNEVSNAGTGIFTLNAGVTLTANVTNKSTASGRNCLQFTEASPAVGYIVGNCTSGGGAFSLVGAANNGSGTLNITGNCTGGSSNQCLGVANNSTGILNITGNCTGGLIAPANGARNVSTGTINITGNVLGGTGSTAEGVRNVSTGIINITGNATGGSAGNTYGAQNLSTGTLTLIGIATGGTNSTAYGVNNESTGQVNITRAKGSAYGPGNASGLAAAVGANNLGLGVIEIASLEYGTYGMSPTSGTGIRLKKLGSNVAVFNYCDTAGAKPLIDATQNAAMPAASNVRSGVSYASGAQTGSCAVPAAGSVALGVPVDNTTGTAALTPAAVWEYATREITGGLVDTATTLTNAPIVPTASQIASQVRTELSSELAKVSALNPTRLGQVTTTEILGNLLSQANS